MASEANPFVAGDWLSALERTECVHRDSGWIPLHVGLWSGERLVGAAPTYAKTHSMGEFVYDWAWASFSERMGRPYYPKLVVGSPFSPVTGERLMVAQPGGREHLVNALLALCEQTETSGLHIQFCPEAEALELAALGGHHRIQLQFHWHNRNYGDFDDFLQDFRSKRRKAIRRERRKVQEHYEVRVLEGGEIQSEDMECMSRFYRSTCARYGAWDYLRPEMWDWLSLHARDRLVLFMAYEQGQAVAGAFCVRKGAQLFGRYWGCGDLPEGTGLHFELCFYAPIEWAIEQGISRFEPGQGGGTS